MTPPPAGRPLAVPSLTGSLEVDAKALADAAADGDAALARLPGPPERDAAQRAEADRIHRACRRHRGAFLAAHADRVYDRLTEGRARRLRVTELALAAAERFPGLVPTRTRLADERSRLQADKEGWEIDQGLFFHAVLGSPASGGHLIDTMLMPTPRGVGFLDTFLRTGQVRLDRLLVERRDAVAYLTVDSPGALNAEDDQLIADMDVAVDLVLLDPGVRVGVLRGGVMTHRRYAGRRVFSAGINLAHLHEGKISYTGFLLGRELGYIHKIYRGLLPDTAERAAAAWPHRTVHKPWVAAVDAFAIGGGAQLLTVFDHVVGAADAYVSLPAAQEGIVPGAANLRLGRLVGSRMTRRLLLDGRKIWASEPDGRLLFDEVVDPKAMDRAVEAAAVRLAAPAVVANRRVLHAAEEPVEAFRGYMSEFALEQALRMYSADVLDKVARRAADSPPPNRGRP